MTLYDLFHSIPPEVLMASVMEVNAHNNVVSNLEASFLPGVLNALPDKSYDDEKMLVYSKRLSVPPGSGIRYFA